MSGTYLVALHRDGETLTTSIRVNADRNVIATARDEQSGFAYVNLLLQLPERAAALAANSGDSGLISRLRGLAADAAALESALTSQPDNSQDNDFLEDRLRERLTALSGLASRSSPSAEEQREAAEIERETDAVLDRYRTFIATQIMPLSHRLARDGAALDLAQKPAREPQPGPDTDEHADRREAE